jgi:hypothetical protein
MRLLVAGAVLVSLLVGGLAVMVLPRLSASAAHAPGQVTRGDAEAIFNAAFTGCGAIMAHGNVHEG